MKGNTAEYLVCYELQKNGIPVWQLGGNNKRWDLVFLAGEDEFIPAQVKARSQTTVVFKKEDLIESKGYYFIWYDPINSNTKDKDGRVSYLEAATESILGARSNSALLVFDSVSIMALCNKSTSRPSNEGKSSISTNLTQPDIVAGLSQWKTFLATYAQKIKIIEEAEEE